jgi:hypothetical protein
MIIFNLFGRRERGHPGTRLENHEVATARLDERFSLLAIEVIWHQNHENAHNPGISRIRTGSTDLPLH